MRKHKVGILFSIILLFVLFGIVCVDLAGTFSYSDIPFVIVFLLYWTFTRIQRSTSFTTFIFILFLLCWMMLSYIPTGPGVITERIGEWFYLFFIFGLTQYIIESWKKFHI
jgi:hypothetical protein